MLSAKDVVSDFRRTYFCNGIRSSQKKKIIKFENVQFIVTQVDVCFSEWALKA